MGSALAVAVPVRNEAIRLPRLLRSLARQEGAPPFSLCVFFDNCVDNSETIVGRLALSLPFPVVIGRCNTVAPPNAGLARARAMALALDVVPNGALLTTDADSEPRPDWIGANLTALNRADLVAGRIIWGAAPKLGMQARLTAYYDRLHSLRRSIDPVDWEDAATHHWVSGASMAVSTRVYRELGGFPPVAAGEDAEFANVVSRAGYRVRRDARVVVKTSTRTRGRVEGGFSTTVAATTAAIVLPRVAHPEDETWRFRMQAAARRHHSAAKLDQLAVALGLPLGEVRQVAGECTNGEAFAARIVGAPVHGMRSVDLHFAESMLSTMGATELQGAA